MASERHAGVDVLENRRNPRKPVRNTPQIIRKLLVSCGMSHVLYHAHGDSATEKHYIRVYHHLQPLKIIRILAISCNILTVHICGPDSVWLICVRDT